MSVIITARKINIISAKKNISGCIIPFLATSIIPLEKSAPNAIPILATTIKVLKETALDPIPEFKKFTASFATPTIKSIDAKIARATSIIT